MVRSRPTTTPAYKRVAAKVSTSATLASAPMRTSSVPKSARTILGVAAAGFLILVVLIAWAASSGGGSSHSAPASKSSPTMSGHYIRAATNPTSGKSSDDDWHVTPCGDGCVSAATTLGGPAYGQAQLVNGAWTMDAGSDTALCLDGSSVPNAETTHYTRDPYTLAGTTQVTEKFAVCGASSPVSFTNNVQLRHVASRHDAADFAAELRADGISVSANDAQSLATWVCSQRAAGYTSPWLAQHIAYVDHYLYPQGVEIVSGSEYRFCASMQNG